MGFVALSKYIYISVYIYREKKKKKNNCSLELECKETFMKTKGEI